MKIPYFCCIGAELKRYEKDFDFMNQVYLYKIPADDTIEEVLAQDYFQQIADTVLQDDILYIYEPTAQVLHTCRFNKQGGHITAVQLANNIPDLTPNRVLISDATGRIKAGDVTLEYLKNKVNLNGSSIMTGPLKFKAGSFSGAIAGGLGDGVSIYKIKADGTIDSEVASLTKTNGFTPGTTNAQNIGSTTLKWKDAHIARVITAIINNGYDIAVPVTNSADSFALESEITAINGKIPAQASTSNQLADKSFVNSSIATNTANFIGTFNSVADLEAYSGTVTNNDYAFVVGTDSAGNTTYNRYKYTTATTPASWVYEYTLNNSSFTSDQWAAINSGVTTSDVSKARSAVQPGDVGNGTITITQGGTTKGTFTTNQGSNTTIDLDAGGVGGANTSLSNLTSTGANIGNWSSNVSNCITEIPQDIKLTLNNGTLKMKEGSKVYHPDGTTYTALDDESTTAGQLSDGKYFVITGNAAFVSMVSVDKSCSGATDSLAGTPHHLWYDTSNNTIKHYGTDGMTYGYRAFPLAIITISGGTITSIDQVFNGFGYIGSTVFALPGVKGLIPNGRNADGTLKNTAFEISSVKTITNGLTANYTVALNSNGILLDSVTRYSEQENYNSGSSRNYALVGSLRKTSGVISDFNMKSAFHAVDYSEADFVVAFQRPTAANNYTWFRKYKSGWVEQGGTQTFTAAQSVYTTVNLPVEMANSNYTLVSEPGYTIRTGTNQGQNVASRNGLKTTTTIFIAAYGIGSTDLTDYIDWQVSGMAAS